MKHRSRPSSPAPAPLSAASRGLCALLALGAAAAAQTPVAVSPADRAGLEGSSFTHYPLGRKNARMQTLHDDVPGGTVLSGHAYRRDAITVRGLVDGLTCDLQVTVSMAPAAAAQASTTFAQNVGQNAVVVLPRTQIALSPTDRPTIDPAATWELVIPYATPFVVPPGGGTVCVDVEIFGNQSPGGTDQNLSLYLDAHQHYADGRAMQPAYRFGQGCPAPGQAQDSYATLDLWRLAGGTTECDVSIRDGVADGGSGTTRALLMMGHAIDGTPLPFRSDCPFWSSNELWFALPGTMDAAGDYDGTLPGLPLLPPGYRLWCQAASIDLTTVDMAFSDALTLVTPPYGALPIPTARVANANDRTALTGTFSYAVPVMAFF
ncbi:MAG: hypothetical protein H6835_18135 [Planctomycetes bacterium]|nr:hypothetical protein [Planctomycetota bacterium]